MSRSPYDDLLNGALDGTLSVEERAELRELLTTNEDARARYIVLEQVWELLDDLGPAEAPADLMPNVMHHVRAQRTGRWRRGRVNGGGAGMARKVMYGLAAAAAVVLAVYALTGFPPIGGGTEGTIGQAKRYQAAQPQIAEKDVALGDTAAQAFLQSDVFDRLIKNEAARKLLSNGALRDALLDPALAQALSGQALAQALAAPALSRLFTDAGLSRELLDPALVRALNDAEFARELTNPGLARVLGDTAFRQNIKSAELSRELRGAELAKMMRDMPAISRALSEDAALAQALTSDLVSAGLRDQLFAKALSDLALARGFASDSLLRAMSNAELRGLLADSSLRAQLNSDALKAALRAEGFATALRSQGFLAELRGN
jgi:hypothetical protein